MSLIDGILGSLGLDGILGSVGGSLGGSSDTELGATVAANPELHAEASDVLGVSTGDGGVSLSGIGDLGVGLSAPILIGVSASSEASADAGVDGGGLLGGLL